MSDADLAACRFNLREWREKAQEKIAEVDVLEGDIARCRRRLLQAEHLLRWVRDEADLSGQMELSAEIRAFLAEI